MTVTRSDATAPSPAPTDVMDPDAPVGSATSRSPDSNRSLEAAPSSTRSDVVPVELRAIVVIAVVIGVILRFVCRSPLWLDEALSVNIAQLPLGDITEALRHDGHPPLYYALLHLWSSAFGTSDLAVRAFSGALSVATLPLAYLVGVRAGGRRLGWLTLGVFAICPFVLRYATEARMYALLSFLVVLGYLVVDDMVRRGRCGWGRVVAGSLIGAALLYSHYWGLWLLGGLGVLMVLVAFKGYTPEMRRGASRVLVSLVGAGLLFVPWLPVMLYQSQHTGTPWAGPVRPTTMVAIMLTDFGSGGTGFVDAQFTGGVLLVLLLLGVFGRAIDGGRIELILRSVRQFRLEALLIALTLAIALVVGYASGSAYASRYTSVILPVVLLVAAGGLSRFIDRRVAVGAFSVLLVLFSLGAIVNARTSRTQALETATAINDQAQVGDIVVYCPDQLAPAAMRVIRPGLQHVAFPDDPTGGRSPERVEWVDYANRNRANPGEWADRLVASAPRERGIFVVWSGNYKTHQGTCEALIGRVSEHRGLGHPLLSEDGAEYFEHESLLWFPGAAGS